MAARATSRRSAADEEPVRGFAGELLFILVAGAALAAASFLARDLVLAIAGTVVLLVPPFALAWSFHVGRRAPWIDILPALGLTVGIVALTGLALALLPFGLNRWSWLGAGAMMLSVALLLGAGRQVPLPALPVLPRVRARDIVLLVAAIGLMGAAVVQARAGVTGPAEAFSELWVVRTPTPAPGARVGVANHEGQAADYRLDVSLNGVQVVSWSSIHLAAGETWTSDLSVTLPAGSRLEARLYLASRPNEAYRIAWLATPGPSAVAPGTGPSG